MFVERLNTQDIGCVKDYTYVHIHTSMPIHPLTKMGLLTTVQFVLPYDVPTWNVGYLINHNVTTLIYNEQL